MQPSNQSVRSSRRSDAVSFRSLQHPVNYHDYGRLNPRSNIRQEQRSADNLLYSTPQDILQKSNQNSIEIYSEPIIHDSTQRSRAQPQVPIYRKMGRRASEGSTFTDKDIYADVPNVNNRDKAEMVVGNTKDVSKSGYLAESSASQQQVSNSSLDNMPVLSYPSVVGCRLSLDAGRRTSSASITSSMADGSKDSLSSFDSSSTLTGLDPDDQIYMNKLRKSVQKKEEFLSNNHHNNNSNHSDSTLIRKEFYGRPKKLEKSWPPPHEQQIRNESPSRNTKPTHQNFQRVKNDIDNERDYTNIPSQNEINVRQNARGKEWKMQEASPAPSQLENQTQQLNGANDNNNCYTASLQMVHKRAKQFESGKPLPEDDPSVNDRTSFYKSELSRMSEKKVVPNVPDRTREFELMSSNELLRENTSAGSTNVTSAIRRSHRDTRSLESTGK